MHPEKYGNLQWIKTKTSHLMRAGVTTPQQWLKSESNWAIVCLEECECCLQFPGHCSGDGERGLDWPGTWGQGLDIQLQPDVQHGRVHHHWYLASRPRCESTNVKLLSENFYIFNFHRLSPDVMFTNLESYTGAQDRTLISTISWILTNVFRIWKPCP